MGGIHFLRKLAWKIQALFSTKEKRTIHKGALPSDSDESEHIHIDWTILLPDPTLKCIFEYYLYTYGAPTSIQSLGPASPLYIEADPHFGPLFLTQICPRWRRVAISMSHLWSSMRISKNHHPDLLKQWLKRSNDTPLSLSLDCIYRLKEIRQVDQHVLRQFDPHPHLYNSRINVALRLVATEMHRWHRLDLSLDFESASALMQLSLNDASNLKEVSIQFVETNSASMPPRLLQFLNSSLDYLPSLRRLSWESTLPREQMTIPLRNHDILNNPQVQLWRRLYQVELKTGLTMFEAATFLGICINASSVTIDCIVDNEMDSTELQTMSAVYQQQTDILILPKLEQLSIGFGGAACDCTLVLERFSIPSLKTLCIYNFQTDHASCDRIEDLFNRISGTDLDASLDSSPTLQLRRLLIKDDYMPEEIVLRLVCIPALHHVPIVNFYTRKFVKWEFFSETLGNIDLAEKVEHLDLGYGMWIGWGGFPISSQC